MHRLRNLVRPAAATAFAFAMLPASGAHAMDVPALIGRAGSASAATVYLVPPMALFRNALDEARMRAAGCRYATVDPAAIRALADLLKTAGVRSDVVYQTPDIREGVYLTLDDGTHLRFLLQDNNGGRTPVSGVAATSQGDDLQTVSVTAKDTLALDLRRWAATRGGTGTGESCARQSAEPMPR